MKLRVLHCAEPAVSNALRFKCRGCGVRTGPAAFVSVDLEFRRDHPLCTSCSESAELDGKVCEHCDESAVAVTDGGALCDHHFERYASGYLAND